MWRQRERAERRQRVLEEKRMGVNKRYRSSSFTDSVGSASEGERPHKTGSYCRQCSGCCLTFPPAGRYDDYDHWNRDEDNVPRGLGVPPAPVNTDIAGDEAYQRRLTMSSGPPQSAPSVVAVDRVMSGDDAYARRMAMSSGQAPSFSKEDTGDDAYQRRVATSSVPHVHQSEPPSEPSPSLAYNPFAPVSVPPPPPGPPPSIEDEVARKREAAAAIAAKFGALAALQPPEDLNPAPQNPTQQYALVRSFSRCIRSQRSTDMTHLLSLSG